MGKLGGELWLDDIDPADENSGVPTDLRAPLSRVLKELASTEPQKSSPLSASRPAGAAVREGRLPSQPAAPQGPLSAKDAGSSTKGSGGMKICLNMIVRNEAAILEKCLASVPADYYVIGDTGSTDGTQALIKSHFDARGIAGEIHEFPFRDFSQARNEALNRARASAGVFDYILLTDADMELVVVDPDWKKSLRFPVCSARQTNSISYYNTRLFHRSIEAHYVCKTHEFLSTPISSQPIESIWFADHANGSSRVEKTERDLRLLKEELAEKPNDQRSLFYIAQTYKDLGRWYDALSYYTKRIAAGGFPEEVWYSVYMSAICYKNLNKESQFIAKALEAFEMRPTRAESLLPLAKHYRETGKNELSLMVSDRASEIEYPKGDQLFVEDFVYEHAFDNEIAIAGFYSKNKRLRERGYDECMHLSACSDTSEGMQKLALSNSRFYAKNAVELFPSFQAKEIQIPCSPGFVTSGASIALSNEGISSVVRTVNYKMQEGVYTAPNDVVKTENYLCTLDSDLNVVTTVPITHGDFEPKTAFNVQGYEDCRLFWWKGEWWATATVRDRHPSAICEIVLFTLKGDKERVFRTAGNEQITRELETQNQKNWMPLVVEDPASGGTDRLLFIYRSDPTIVLEVDELDGEWQLMNRHTDEDCPFELTSLRGGSQCVLWKPERYLAIAHESFRENVPWRYLHRFVELDEQFQIVRVSDLFQFNGPGVEFCAGLAKQGEKLLISYGVEDAQAFVAFVNAYEVDKQLKGATGLSRRRRE